MKIFKVSILILLVIFLMLEVSYGQGKETIIEASEKKLHPKTKEIIALNSLFIQIIELTATEYSKLETVERQGLTILKGNCQRLVYEWLKYFWNRYHSDKTIRIGSITTSTPIRFGQHQAGVIQAPDGKFYIVEFCNGDKLFIKEFLNLNKLLGYYKGKTPTITWLK